MREPQKRSRQTRQDTFIKGLLLGLSVPFLLFMLLSWLNGAFGEMIFGIGLSDRLLAITALVCNVFVVNWLNQRRRDALTRGVVTATLGLSFAVLFYYYNHFFA